jgi:lysophospholipase L1-like esterase
MRTWIFFSLLFFVSCHRDIDIFTPDVPDSEFAYLALGDTIGEGVKPEESFPVSLESGLVREGFSVTKPSRVIAQTGWTCGNLQTALDEARIEPGEYNLVTVLIGVNDQYLRIPVQLYPDRFAAVLQRAIRIAEDKDRVIIVSIPDYSVTPFVSGSNAQRVRMELEEYNRLNRKIADSLSIAYVDITDISRKAGADLSYLAADRLHPSAKMYKEWVERITPVALELLKK